MIARNFLGFSCAGGVNPALDAKLTVAENLLQTTFTSQSALGLFTGTFTEWAQIRQPHGATHPGGHAPGDAMDVNFDTNPYIATRTPTPSGGVIYGGEAPEPSGIRMSRIRATTVYDRAMAFFSVSSNVANVSARASAETTLSVFQRFKAASDALRDYLGLAFTTTLPTTIANPPPPGGNNPPPVGRTPVPNAHNASLPQLLAAIPRSERRSEADARSRIDTFVSNLGFPVDHLGWNITVDFWLRQILRDYESVRIPMEFGAPSLTPSQTRNPANGFLTLREEVVTTLAGDPLLVLVNPLMRWGICDFGTASGDVQHFDLRPRIASGVNGDSPPEVKIQLASVAGVQQALGALGFDAGDVTGTASATTTAAINAFRTSRGLLPGGMDIALQVALDLALREAAVPF